MEEQSPPSKRTLNDCSTIISLLITISGPLSFTDFKKHYKEKINNKLLVTALNLLITEKIIEKKLILGRIRYDFSDRQLSENLNFLLSLPFPATIKSSAPFSSNLDNDSFRKLIDYWFYLILREYIETFLKNELTRKFPSAPTSYVMLSILQNKISIMLDVYLTFKTPDEILKLITNMDLKNFKSIFKSAQTIQSNLNKSLNTKLRKQQKT